MVSTICKGGVFLENTLGHRIKALRLENNITQKNFAKYLNISNSTLSQYESNLRVPNDEIKKEIAKYFNVSMDYLMGLSNIKNPYSTEYKNNIDLSLDILEILALEGEISEDYLKKDIPEEEKNKILNNLKKMIDISKIINNKDF